MLLTDRQESKETPTKPVSQPEEQVETFAKEAIQEIPKKSKKRKRAL